MTKKVEEVDSQVKIVEAKVDRLRSAYEEKSRVSLGRLFITSLPK